MTHASIGMGAGISKRFQTKAKPRGWPSCGSIVPRGSAAAGASPWGAESPTALARLGASVLRGLHRVEIDHEIVVGQSMGDAGADAAAGAGDQDGVPAHAGCTPSVWPPQTWSICPVM